MQTLSDIEIGMVGGAGNANECANAIKGGGATGFGIGATIGGAIGSFGGILGAAAGVLIGGGAGALIGGADAIASTPACRPN